MEENTQTNNTFEEAVPSLESIMGVLRSNTREVLIKIFEEKQISTTGIIQLLPREAKKGEELSTAVSGLTKIFDQYGVVVKYITKSSVSYPEENGLKVINPRAVVSSDSIPLFFIGRATPKPFQFRSTINYGKYEKEAMFVDEAIDQTSDYFIPEVNWYLNSLKRHKILEKEEVYKLIERAQIGDFEARDLIIMHNRRLVLKIANTYKRAVENPATLEFNDLIQEGTFGLFKAIDKFKISLNFHFSTYAYYWISQAIGRFLNDMQLTVRLPSHLHEQLNKLRKTVQKMEKLTGVRPSQSEIAETMGVKTQRIFMLEKVEHEKVVPLNTLTGDEDEYESAETHVPDTGIVSPIVTTDREFLSSNLKRCLLKYLSEKEYYIIKRRWGLENCQPLTLQDIGNEYGVTRERIRQIEAIAIEKIKEDEELRDFAMEYLQKD